MTGRVEVMDYGYGYKSLIITDKFEVDGSVGASEVISVEHVFSSPRLLHAGVTYTVTVEYTGHLSGEVWHGEGGETSAVFDCSGKKVVLEFFKSNSSNNGSGVSNGQIPQLTFIC